MSDIHPVENCHPNDTERDKALRRALIRFGTETQEACYTTKDIEETIIDALIRFDQIKRQFPPQNTPLVKKS